MRSGHNICLIIKKLREKLLLFGPVCSGHPGIGLIAGKQMPLCRLRQTEIRLIQGRLLMIFTRDNVALVWRKIVRSAWREIAPAVAGTESLPRMMELGKRVKFISRDKCSQLFENDITSGQGSGLLDLNNLFAKSLYHQAAP